MNQQGCKKSILLTKDPSYNEGGEWGVPEKDSETNRRGAKQGHSCKSHTMKITPMGIPLEFATEKKTASGGVRTRGSEGQHMIRLSICHL